jgi:hypothetical protein
VQSIDGECPGHRTRADAGRPQRSLPCFSPSGAPVGWTSVLARVVTSCVCWRRRRRGWAAACPCGLAPRNCSLCISTRAFRGDVVLELSQGVAVSHRGLPRADRLARLAVDALLRIDVELVGEASGGGTDVFVDAVHWTGVDARGVEGSGAQAGDDPRHRCFLVPSIGPRRERRSIAPGTSRRQRGPRAATTKLCRSPTRRRPVSIASAR